MSVTTERATAAHWTEPDPVAPRGTLIVIPGRGEAPELYERFGRRIAGDGYWVHTVADPVAVPALTTSQVLGLAPEVRPYVLVGSDTGALFAAGRVASGGGDRVDAVMLAGLSAPPEPTAGEPAAADVTHRILAATIVPFLERLRLGAELITPAASSGLSTTEGSTGW
jgi:alpha-beta hydrolase superfamily lysophospholipase